MCSSDPCLIASPVAARLALPRSVLGATAANAGSQTAPVAAAAPRGGLERRSDLHRRGGKRRWLLRALGRTRWRALQLQSRGADAGAPPRRAQRGWVLQGGDE